jgi:hypothetical protein
VCTLPPPSSYFAYSYTPTGPTPKVAECDAINLGILAKYLIYWNLWPDCQASAWKRSPATLMRSLREMSHYGSEIVCTRSNKGNAKDTHDECGPRNRIVKAIDDYFLKNVICCKLPGLVSDLVLSDEESQDDGF